MGKTFCSKHERFYEKACEYCVAPALPVVAVETVPNPAPVKPVPVPTPLSTCVQCSCGGVVFDRLFFLAHKTPMVRQDGDRVHTPEECVQIAASPKYDNRQPLTATETLVVDGGFHTPKECKGPWQRVPQRLTKVTLDELFASPPMVQDAPYDPKKVETGKPWPYGESPGAGALRDVEALKRVLTDYVPFSKRTKLQTCACGKCHVPEGETFVPKDSYDKHAHMRCEIFRRRPG